MEGAMSGMTRILGQLYLYLYILVQYRLGQYYKYKLYCPFHIYIYQSSLGWASVININYLIHSKWISNMFMYFHMEFQVKQYIIYIYLYILVWASPGQYCKYKISYLIHRLGWLGGKCCNVASFLSTTPSLPCASMICLG